MHEDNSYYEIRCPADKIKKLLVKAYESDDKFISLGWGLIGSVIALLLVWLLCDMVH